MIARIRIDSGPAIEEMRKSLDSIATDYCRQAAEAGGTILLDAYRKSLQGRAHSTGKFHKGKGTAAHQIITFQKSYDSVAKRTLLFKDRRGAYCVVGQAVNAANKYFSPQAMWLEEGADGRSQPNPRGERYKYSDGQGTGVMEAEHTLANAASMTAEASLAAMQEKLVQCLSKQS